MYMYSATILYEVVPLFISYHTSSTHQIRNMMTQMLATITKSTTNTTATAMATTEFPPPLEPVVVTRSDIEKVENTLAGS